MAVARNIVVGFIARTEAFTKGVTKVQKDLEDVRKSVEKSQRTLSNFGKLALAVVGVQGLQQTFKAATRDIEGFAKAAGTGAAERLRRASDAIEKMRTAAVTMVQIGLSKFAPFLELIANKIKRLIDILGQVDYSMVRWAVKIGAIIYFAPKVIGAIVGIVKAVRGLSKVTAIAQALSGPAGIASLLLGAGVAVATVATLNYAFDEIESGIMGAADSMEDFKSAAGGAQAAVQDVAAAMDKVEAAAERFAAPVDELEKLRRQVYEFGKTERQLSELQLQRDTGRGRADGHPIWGEFDSLWDRIEAQQQWAKSVEEATSVFEETRTPLEQYEARISRLNDLLNSGALDWDTYGRAVRMAREKLEGGGRPYNPGEFEVVRRDLVSLTGPDSQRNLQLEEAKKQTRLLETIAHKEGLM